MVSGRGAEVLEPVLVLEVVVGLGELFDLATPELGEFGVFFELAPGRLQLHLESVLLEERVFEFSYF